MELPPGTQVDRYAVERALGHGGLATVYLARHTQLQSWHALKVLDVPAPAIRARLMREGQVQGALRHPNVVGVTNVVDMDGAPVLVLEYVDGPALDSVLKVRRPTLAQADHIARGLLRGVAAAHRVGLVHRDLKPGNVLLAIEEGAVVPKVTDFGLAKLLERPDSPMQTRTGAAMGTPAYMAPEQIRDSAQVDVRADVWSLGVVLYELVSGRRPFDGADTMEIFQAVCEGSYPALDERLPAAVRRAITAALQVDPAARPSDAGALLELWAAGGEPVADAWSEDELEAIWELGPREAPSLSSAGPSTPPRSASDTFALTGTGVAPAEEEPAWNVHPGAAAVAGTVLAAAFLAAGLPAVFPGALAAAGLAGWGLLALSALGVGAASGLAGLLHRGVSTPLWAWFVVPVATAITTNITGDQVADLARGTVLLQIGHGLLALQLVSVAAINAIAMVVETGLPRRATGTQVGTVVVGLAGGFAAWGLSAFIGHGDGYPFLVLLVTAGAAIDVAVSAGPAPGCRNLERARAAVWMCGFFATTAAAKSAYMTVLAGLMAPLGAGDAAAALDALARVSVMGAWAPEVAALVGWIAVAGLVLCVPLAAGVRPRLDFSEGVVPALLVASVLTTGAVGLVQRPGRLAAAEDEVAIALLRDTLGLVVEQQPDAVILLEPVGDLRAGEEISYLTDPYTPKGPVIAEQVDALARGVLACLCGSEGECLGTTGCWQADSEVQVNVYQSDRQAVVEVRAP